MAVYKSIHTGQDIDNAVSVVPDLQTGKQDKLTDVQIANINNVPNKQDKLTETQINNINAVTQLQADVDQNIGDIANLSADIINKNDVGNVTAEDTQEVHYDSVSKKLKTKAGGGSGGTTKYLHNIRFEHYDDKLRVYFIIVNTTATPYGNGDFLTILNEMRSYTHSGNYVEYSATGVKGNKTSIYDLSPSNYSDEISFGYTKSDSNYNLSYSVSDSDLLKITDTVMEL